MKAREQQGRAFSSSSSPAQGSTAKDRAANDDSHIMNDGSGGEEGLRRPRSPSPGTSNTEAHRGRPLGPDFNPGVFTVLCGRGRICTNSSGNIHLRKLVADSVKPYGEATLKADKTRIVTSIIGAVKKAAYPAAAFVKFEEGQWWELNEHFAREKIGCAFRDYLHTKYRSSTKSKQRAKKRQTRNSQQAIFNSGQNDEVDRRPFNQPQQQGSTFSTSTRRSSNGEPGPVTAPKILSVQQGDQQRPWCASFTHEALPRTRRADTGKSASPTLDDIPSPLYYCGENPALLSAIPNFEPLLLGSFNINPPFPFFLRPKGNEIPVAETLISEDLFDDDDDDWKEETTPTSTST